MQDLTVSNLLETVEKYNKTNVLVIGDIMLDRFVYGDVERISPESPIPVLSINREDTMLGGSGNALANLAGLGVKAGIVALSGDDAEGKQIQNTAEDLGITKKNIGLVKDKTRPTTVKTRYLAGHQQLLRSDFEDKTDISDAVAKTLISKAKKQIAQADALIISDYGKGLLTGDILKTIIKEARGQKIPVIIDPKGQDFSKYKGATAVTPNKKELAEATAMPVDTDKQVEKAAQKIIVTCGIDAVIATRGPDGISVIQKGEKPVQIPTKNIEVYDVSGAGDTVIATIAASLAAGADLAQAAALANIAGGIVVAKVGTASIRQDEISAALMSGQRSVQSWAEAVDTVKRWRAKGLKIGFTNGCFDILHQGHVTYLTEARQNCDRLIVGLNKDSSVRILKGADRPVHDESSRGIVLGGLECVDLVTLFGAEKKGDDNTACKLLETLKPDIYFKGGDYTVDEIPETPTVQKYGGEVRVMSEVKGHSTTNSIAKMTDKAA